mmetsp:Transcript_58144/g.123475  ORF Transcript_58144/g.123475 Transcript_58144/m.123475 type:complete len:327 (-) Transcript_58144:256-1236(-)
MAALENEPRRPNVITTLPAQVFSPPTRSTQRGSPQASGNGFTEPPDPRSPTYTPASSTSGYGTSAWSPITPALATPGAGPWAKTMVMAATATTAATSSAGGGSPSVEAGQPSCSNSNSNQKGNINSKGGARPACSPFFPSGSAPALPIPTKHLDPTQTPSRLVRFQMEAPSPTGYSPSAPSPFTPPVVARRNGEISIGPTPTASPAVIQRFRMDGSSPTSIMSPSYVVRRNADSFGIPLSLRGGLSEGPAPVPVRTPCGGIVAPTPTARQQPPAGEAFPTAPRIVVVPSSGSTSGAARSHLSQPSQSEQPSRRVVSVYGRRAAGGA